MNKEEIRIVPQLRFPEFGEEWKLTELENVVELLSGYAFKDLTYIKGGRKLLIPKNFTNYGYASFNNENTKYTTENPNSKYKCKNGDLLILLTDLTPSCELLGKPLFLLEKDGEVLLNQRISKVITSDKIYSRFLLYFFLTDAFHKRIKNTATGSTVKHSSNKIILNSPISLPTKKEQQKIAACLSSLDEVITAETEKLDLLQNHKKGLLQQLFPVEGETQPKFRFPEFKDDGDWEAKLIKEACNKPFSGGTPKSNNSNYYGGDIPFIRSAEINKETTELFLTEEGFQNSSAKMVKRGDVLIAMYGANSGDVAISKIDGAINQAILCLRSRTHNPFLFQYLIFKKDFINNTYLQGGQGNLSGDIIKSIELLFPQNPREQEKIASCLSAADALIEAQAQKIKALQVHKKGLLQQLFPTLSEL